MSWRRSRSTASCSSQAGAPPTPCVSIAPGRRGSAGFEFASAIPGTAGGGVRMNAGAYGSDWRSVLVDAVVAGPDGTRTLGLDELDLSYRHSGLVPGEVVARVRYRLTPKPSDAIKSEVAELLAQRKATQPTNKRTFGSVFKNPDEGPGPGALIERSGLKGHRIGGAVDLGAARELHRERRRSDERGRGRADGGGTAAGARRLRCDTRARGAIPRPARASGAVGKRPSAANTARWQQERERAHAGHRPVRASASLTSSGSRSARAWPRSSSAHTQSRERPRSSPCGRSTIAGRIPADQGGGPPGAPTGGRAQPDLAERRRHRPARREDPGRRLGLVRPVVPEHAARHGQGRARGAPGSPGKLELGGLVARPRDAQGDASRPRARSRGCGCPSRFMSPWGRRCRATTASWPLRRSRRSRRAASTAASGTSPRAPTS